MHRRNLFPYPIAAIERNKYAPSLETAFRIAHAFGLPLTEVFAWEGG